MAFRDILTNRDSSNQVHTATDRATGKKLAVKVQHRGLRETSAGDVAALVGVVHLLGRMFPRDFAFSWLADEIAPHLPLELDFVHEARNAERCARALREAGLGGTGGSPEATLYDVVVR